MQTTSCDCLVDIRTSLRSLHPTGARRVAVETIGSSSREVRYAYDALCRLTQERGELDTPTIARVVAVKISTGAGWLPKPATSQLPQVLSFASRIVVSVYEPAQAQKAQPTSNSPQPLAHLVRSFQSTQGHGFASVFHLSTPSFAFGQGCEHASYVGHENFQTGSPMPIRSKRHAKHAKRLYIVKS